MMNRVARTVSIEGIATPAFIHNGRYYLVNLPVFADGVVDCWGLVDLAGFRAKLDEGWVVTGVPDGRQLSVHGLGAWTVADSRWDLDADQLHDRVLRLIRELNPSMGNLRDFQGRASATVANECPVRVGDPKAVFPDHVTGERISVLLAGDPYFVADLRVFTDGALELGRVPKPETLTLGAFEQAVHDGRVARCAPAGTRVAIHGLGSFAVAQEHRCVDPLQQVREVADLLDRLNRRPDSRARCRRAYETYLADPTVAARDALRVAYELVPEHNRRYLGDMDVKDVPIRMIIYGDQEIENWSHRAAGRADGRRPLPSISVPKPRDE